MSCKQRQWCCITYDLPKTPYILSRSNKGSTIIVMVASKTKSASRSTKKITGQHHRKSKQYHKVYWPYVPIVAIIALGLFIGNYEPTHKNGVLAYATEMSVNSLLDATNNKRQENNQSTLKINDRLTAAAQAKANDMTAKNYWAHTTPSGEEPWKFIQVAGYEYNKAGENLAYGFNSGSETVNGWMNSETHRTNMLDGNYTEVGFGFANAKNFNKSGPETVVVAMYGQPLGGGSANKVPEITARVQPVTSSLPIQNEPATLGVSRLAALTHNSTLLFGVGLMSGLAAAFVFLKHGLAVRKLITEGEEFIVHHPVLDIVLVSLIMVGYVLSQTVGVIR